MDMRSTRSFKSKRKAITAVEGEEGKREEKSATWQNMHTSGALIMMQHTSDSCSGLGRAAQGVPRQGQAGLGGRIP